MFTILTFECQLDLEGRSYKKTGTTSGFLGPSFLYVCTTFQSSTLNSKEYVPIFLRLTLKVKLTLKIML